MHSKLGFIVVDKRDGQPVAAFKSQSDQKSWAQAHGNGNYEPTTAEALNARELEGAGTR